MFHNISSICEICLTYVFQHISINCLKIIFHIYSTIACVHIENNTDAEQRNQYKIKTQGKISFSATNVSWCDIIPGPFQISKLFFQADWHFPHGKGLSNPKCLICQ